MDTRSYSWLSVQVPKVMISRLNRVSAESFGASGRSAVVRHALAEYLNAYEEGKARDRQKDRNA
jgi:metal-responsive CopG/Arc/MetJ family transcriptional regulator